jgi:hypothetical protein
VGSIPRCFRCEAAATFAVESLSLEMFLFDQTFAEKTWKRMRLVDRHRE